MLIYCINSLFREKVEILAHWEYGFAVGEFTTSLKLNSDTNKDGHHSISTRMF